MKSKLIARATVGLAALGLMVPPQALAAEPFGIGNAFRQAAAQIKDVELDAKGSLHGIVTDEQGRPLTRASVKVIHQNGAASETHSDASGRFEIQALKGGLYQLTADRHTEIIRLWSAETGPPASLRSIAVSQGALTVRGQHHVGDVFRSDGFIVAAIIAAAIAIPVVVHNSRDRASDRDDDSSS